jgi:hypothetical protein
MEVEWSRSGSKECLKENISTSKLELKQHPNINSTHPHSIIVFPPLLYLVAYSCLAGTAG